MPNITIELPALGENVESADVVAVLVAVGDSVTEQQGLIEVETEKAAVEVPSTRAGKVVEIRVKAGHSISVGDPIVVLEPVQGTGEGAAKEPADEPDEADQGEVAEAPESDDAGKARRTDAAKPRQPEEARTDDHEEDRREDEAGDRAATARPLEGRSDEERKALELVPAAPTVRRFAREVGVDIAAVPGSGPRGRISIEDVKAFVRRRLREPVGGGAMAMRPRLPDMSAFGPTRTEPMSKVRRVTAEQMTRSWTQVPQVTQHDHADISEMEAARGRYRGQVEAAGGRLTMTAILVKVVASAIRRFPELGASLDVAESAVVFKDYVHIGVAVDTERGLLVPVIRNADLKSITEISRELDDLASRARGRKLTPDEMRGACFTISNLGGIGGTAFTPIVSWPEVGILGVARARTEPVWRDGAFEPRLMLPLSLSYDHRLVDGAGAARFLRWIAEALERPLLLVLGS
jgi:pyruvate dehydrogenase E2 component (dihydrolipoamide acetyltransferase)